MILLIIFSFLLNCGKSEKFNYRIPLAPDSPWPKFRRDVQSTGVSPYLGNPDGNLKWSAQTHSVTFYSSTVIAADGTIYAGGDDGILYAINPDGTLKWTFTVSAEGWFVPGGRFKPAR